MSQYQNFPTDYYQSKEYDELENYDEIDNFNSANLYTTKTNYEIPVGYQQNKKIFQYNCIRGPNSPINSRIYFRQPICTCNYHNTLIQKKYGNITICPYCGYEIKKEHKQIKKQTQTPYDNQRIYVMGENQKTLVGKLYTCKKININTSQGTQTFNQSIPNLTINKGSQTNNLNLVQNMNLNQVNANLQTDDINNMNKLNEIGSSNEQKDMKNVINYNEQKKVKDSNENNILDNEKIQNKDLNLDETNKNILSTNNEVISSENLNEKKIKDNTDENTDTINKETKDKENILEDNINIKDEADKNNIENNNIEGKEKEKENIIEDNKNIKEDENKDIKNDKEQKIDLNENKIIDLAKKDIPDNENIESQNEKDLNKNQKNLINQNEGEQNELLNYYKNKQDALNYNENENAQENNDIINSLKKQKNDINIIPNKPIEEIGNQDKIEKNEENEDININETEQNEEHKIKYVNIERDDVNDKNIEQNNINNRNDELDNKDINNYEENQNIQQNQKLNINTNMNNNDQTENEVAENINNNLNQNNINESSKKNAQEEQIEQNAKFNKDLEEGVEGEEGEEEQDLNNEQYYEEEENEGHNKSKEDQNIKNNEEGINIEEINKNNENIKQKENMDNEDKNNLMKQNDKDIKDKDDEDDLNKFNDEDDELNAMKQKIDKKLNEIEKDLLNDDDLDNKNYIDINEENNDNNNNNKDLKIHNDNYIDNDIESDKREKKRKKKDYMDKINELNEVENVLYNNQKQFGLKMNKRYSVGNELKHTQKSSENKFKFPQSGELLFNPKKAKRKSVQPLFNKYELLRFTERQQNLYASLQPGESIYQKAVEIFPSKYGIEMPYRSQLRQSNYSINSLQKSSNTKRIKSEGKSRDVAEFNEEGMVREGSSLRKSQFKLKKYGKINYYMYKGHIKSSNPFRGLSLYDKTSKERKSLIAKRVKEEGHEFNEIILLEGNVLKKRELGNEEFNKLISILSKFLYTDEEKNLENRDSYEYKINKVSNIIKFMNEEEQNKALELLEEKAKDEYSTELFEKIKIEIEDYKEKIMKPYRSGEISEDGEHRYMISSSRKKIFRKSIK